jgi:hypothetical protein
VKLDEHPTVKRYRERADSRSVSIAQDKLDATWLKSMALEAGADDAALIEINRPEIEDQKGDILRIFPRTRSLMSIVCRLNPENVRCVSRDVSDLEFLQKFERVNSAASRIVKSLSEKGVRALNPSGGFPMDMAKWPGKMWPIAHKPIAIAGGLGAMGHHRIVIHPRFGSFIVLGTILVEGEATAYDRPLDFNPCIECNLCSYLPGCNPGTEGRFPGIT